MESWFKVERSIFENGIINRDSEYLAIWIYLLSRAAYKPQQFIFNGKPIELYEGQFITSRKKISDALGITESKVQRVLSLFEKAHLIEQQTCSKNRIITVLGQPLCQKSEQANERLTNGSRTAFEQQTNTNKKEKKDNKYIRYNSERTVEKNYDDEPSYDLEAFARKTINIKFKKIDEE